MSKHPTNQKHEALFQELTAVLRRYADQMTAAEILAVTSNMVGKVLAMQDQRTMTAQAGMQIIAKNIELGNQQAIAEVTQSKGTA